MNREQELTTADLARTSEDMRGHSDEQVVAREPRDERISADAPAADTTSPSIRDGARREPVNAAAGTVTGETRDVTGEARDALFPAEEANRFHTRWMDAQAAFVDEPRAAVERADSLVAEVMKKLAEGFAKERAWLERQWDRGDNVTTEDLRLALQRYRSFFDRLLKI
jgi:hypothetical protein